LIIPVHNEQENLEWHHDKILKHLKTLDLTFEIIYVNDGSTDNSLSILKKLSKDTQTHFISFSRNFGKESATTAGLKKAKGEAIVIIDGDGQHPIELIDTFIKEWEAGYQVVIGVRESNKGEGIIKAFGSKLFYAFLRVLGSNESTVSGLTDFRLLDRRVVDEYNKLTEHNRIARNLIDWLGFKRKLIPFHANERHAGVASYSVSKLFKLAVDGIIKHSTKPLKFIGGAGFIISFISAILAIFIIIEQYILRDPLELFISGTALLAVFLSFMVGVVLVCQGLLALYIENVYYETQNRPLFIIDEEN
jgi:dolichol-phosphate mannosyltransferase